TGKDRKRQEKTGKDRKRQGKDFTTYHAPDIYVWGYQQANHHVPLMAPPAGIICRIPAAISHYCLDPGTPVGTECARR
ncbi:hypothetical protein KQI52_10730, partial [bacterium]|nr:hypothetical protein [bacterium]